MRVFRAAIVAAAMSCAAALPVAAITVPIPPDFFSYYHLKFDSTLGEVEDYSYDGGLPILAPGPGAVVFAPTGGGVLPALQVFSVGDAVYSLKINDVAVDWDEVVFDLYRYYNIYALPLGEGSNIIQVTQVGGSGADSTLNISGGLTAIPAPAALPLLIAGLAGLGALRGRRRGGGAQSV